MPTIHLETIIRSSPEVCFDLSRSIDLHIISTAATNEKAVAGVTSGLIGMGQTVTWQAKHLGFLQHLTTTITAYERPFHFRDEQLKGIFKALRHDHFFAASDNLTRMTDVFFYESPGWIFGKLFNQFYLDNYMEKLLWERNRIIKHFAESGEWSRLLPSQSD